MAESFIRANIPIHKLRHVAIKDPFSQMMHPIPSAETCRKSIENIFQRKKNEVKNKLKNNLFYLIIDESQINNSKYLSIQIGMLISPFKHFLIYCRIKEAVNCDVICDSIQEALKEYDLDYKKFSLMISDAASYMVKAGRVLKEKIPNLFHVTCFAHLIHNCAFKVKDYFKSVDFLISSVKRLVLKSKDRKKMFVNISPPPEPIVTRWNSWLLATEYYLKNLPEVKKIVNKIKDDGLIVKNAKEAIEQKNLYSDLIYIQENYNVLSKAIEKIENNCFSIEDAFENMKQLNFKEDRACIGKYIKSRWENNEISDILNFSNESFSPENYIYLKKCPSSSISIERNFSLLGNLLKNNRHFSYENIEKYMFLYTSYD